MSINKTKHAFAGLIGILLSLCIIGILWYYAFKLYAGRFPDIEKQVQTGEPKTEGENPYTTLIDSTEAQVDELNERIRAKEKRWDDML